MTYKLTLLRAGDSPVYNVIKTDGGMTISIPFDPANTDYQQYLAWLAEGNEPLPPDEVPE